MEQAVQDALEGMVLVADIPQGAPWPISITRGRKFEYVFTLTEIDLVTPITLVGYTAQSQIRDRSGSTVLADFTCVVDGLDGTVTISLTAAETALILDGAVYDVALIDGSAEPEVFITESRVDISDPVTAVV